MSTLEEFRQHVEGLLHNLTDAEQRRGAFEEDADSIPPVALIIHIAVAVEGLFDKTPVDPPVLREITAQIRALPLVSRIEREYDNILAFDKRTEGRDLEALKWKLREMLEKIPKPAVSAAISQSPSKRLRGPQAAMAKHEKIAAVVAPFGGDWKQEHNLDQIAAQLDRANVPVSKSWPEHKPPVRSWSRAVTNLRQAVVKTIEYSLWMVKRRNQPFEDCKSRNSRQLSENSR
jgi:hypothetical protein